MTSVSIAALPKPLSSRSKNPVDVHEVEPGTITLTAHISDDLFADPSTDAL